MLPFYRPAWAKEYDASMTREELRIHLLELQGELERTPCADEAARQRLRALMAEVQAAIDCTEEDVVPRYRSLVAHLREDIRYFEGRHPLLTRYIARVIETIDLVGL